MYLLQHLSGPSDSLYHFSHRLWYHFFASVLQVALHEFLLAIHYLCQSHLQLVSKKRVVLRTGTVEKTLGLWVCFYHAADNGCKLSLDAEEAFEEGSSSLDASSLIGRISLEVMAVLRVKTEAVMVIVALNAHLFTQLDGILVSKVGQLSSPLQYYHHLLNGSFHLLFCLLCSFSYFQLQFSRKSFKMAALLKD